MSRPSAQRSPQVSHAPLIKLTDNDDDADALIAALVENRQRYPYPEKVKVLRDKLKGGNHEQTFNQTDRRGSGHADPYPRAWRGISGGRY
jgi:hypothetical protein